MKTIRVTIGERFDRYIRVSKLVEFSQILLEHTIPNTEPVTQSVFKKDDITIAEWTFTITLPEHSFDYVYNFLLDNFDHLELTYIQ